MQTISFLCAFALYCAAAGAADFRAGADRAQEETPGCAACCTTPIARFFKISAQHVYLLPLQCHSAPLEGELRSREYEKDGLTQKIFECRGGSILKLHRAIRQEEPHTGDDSAA